MLRGASLTEGRILVVDDQLAYVALLEDLLDPAGYTAVWDITDPRQALTEFRPFVPDLVPLDRSRSHGSPCRRPGRIHLRRG